MVQGLRERKKRFVREINRFAGVGSLIGGMLVGCMTGVVTYGVVMRYIVKAAVGWSEEVSTYLMIWTVFLGASYTLMEDAHIRVDFLISKISEKARWRINLFGYCVGLFFSGLLFWKGMEMVYYSLKFGDRSIGTGFPLFIPELSVPVGSFSLFLQFAVKVLSFISSSCET